MKKYISLLLLLTLLLTVCFSGGALALDYTGNLGNEATFETMTEARANAPAAMQPFYSRGKYVPHPAMANYPGDSTYVYRSADMYGINAAVRINTNLVVYTDETFAAKEDALNYLKELGLIDIIEEARGSVILVTPSDPEKGFTSEDQKHYYALQTALFSINAGGEQDGEAVTYVDASYYGGYSFYYAIGIDGGATFLNNYVAGTLDYVSRIGGMLLINGKMDRIREVAGYVPAYLVNAPQSVVDKYEAANTVNAMVRENGKTIRYNQQFPLRKVVTLETEEVNKAELIRDAYYSLFVQAQRAQALLQGLYTASTPYQGYGNDSAPYSLAPRNAMFNDVTADGIHLLTRVDDELFSNIKTEEGEYLQTWYEYLPEEVLDGTAPEGTVPLILANHGGGDDPRQFVDGNGLLELAGAERLAIVAPYHQNMGYGNDREAANETSILQDVLPELVKYMLETYPALDASRVYVTGYSMGAGATMRTIYGDASLFAAAVPMAVGRVIPIEEMTKQFETVDLPILMTCSEYDLSYLYVFNPESTTMGPAYYTMLDMWLGFNEMELLPKDLDFDQYPITGFSADQYRYTVLNDEYGNHEWYFVNDKGVPMVGLNITECLLHALYPDYANLFWDFAKHYSRDLTTGEIVYNPYVR